MKARVMEARRKNLGHRWDSMYDDPKAGMILSLLRSGR